jgi:hypothetical protein
VSRFTTLCIAALLSAPVLATAEEAKPPPPPKWYDTFEIHGLVDAYYGANLSHGQADPNLLRALDATNGFQVAYTKLSLSAAPSDKVPAGFKLDLGFGPVADLVAYKNVQQAYVTVALPKSVTLDVGRFSTPIGAEVIEAKDNLLYSRSILFTFIPFTHTGARATIPFGPEGLTGSVALTNGWDVPSPPALGSAVADSRKTLLASLLYSGADATTLALNLSYGDDPTATKSKTLVDLVAGRTFGAVTLNLNFDYGTGMGSTSLDSFYGLAGIVRYAFKDDVFRLTARGEYVQLTPPAGGTKEKLIELTVGGSLPMGTNAELRAEYRYDKADQAVLAGTSKSQSTVQLAALVWF